MSPLGKIGRGLVLACCLLAGCSVTPGKSLTLFPQGQRLLDSTREVSQNSAEPLPLPRELDKHVLPAYVVEPGDVLLVQPAALDSPVRLPGDQPVMPDGTISLGGFGCVNVAGYTLAHVEALVNGVIQARVRGAGPVTVRLIARQSKFFYVLGEVNAPGAYPLCGRETVLDGILAAGGLTDRASRCDIILSRPTAPRACRVVLPICYREIVQLGDTTTNYQLAPGDRIFVATRSHDGGLFSFLFHKPKECPACSQPQAPCDLTSRPPPPAPPQYHY